MKNLAKRLLDLITSLKQDLEVLSEEPTDQEPIGQEPTETISSDFPWEEYISKFDDVIEGNIDEFVKKEKKKILPKAKLRELESLHDSLRKAKKKLEDYFKTPPVARKDLDSEISAIQGAMADVLKDTGMKKVETTRYIFSLRRTPAYYKVVSEKTAVNSLKKKKLGRFIKVEETLDMAKLKNFLKSRGLTIPGLKKMTADVSIYIYEKHEEGEVELIHVVGPEGFEEDYENIEEEMSSSSGTIEEDEESSSSESSSEEFEDLLKFTNDFAETSAFRGQYDFLSNFHPAPTSFEGKVYPTSEHAYQAAKTLDSEIRETIRKLRTPGDAKRYARKIPLRSDWEKIKTDVMKRIVRTKFESNPKLMEKLIATKGIDIVENNTWGDTFWGKSGGKGQNQLGKILAEVREAGLKKISSIKTMAIVGSRETTSNMLQATRYQTKKALDAGWGIVTGGAKGVDEESIREVLRQNACKKLTVYLPKTIESQPAAVRPLLKKVRDLGANVVENSGVKRAAKETGKAVSEISYGQAAFTRNKDIVGKADAMTAIQKGGSKGTQHSINAALKKEIPVKQIDEKLNARLLKQIMNKLKIKHLGNLTKFLKGTLKVVPGILPIFEAIDLGLLWKDMDNLEKDIEAGTANEQQKKIWEWLQQKKEASEGEEWGEIDLEEEFEEKFENEEEFSEKINAPTFAYQTVYNKKPAEFLSGRTDAPKKMWRGRAVDEGLKEKWLEELNNLPVEIRSTDEGKSESRPAFVVLRMPEKYDDLHEQMVSNLKKQSDLFVGFDIGQGNRPRICVAGKIRNDQGEKWSTWWNSLAEKILTAYNETIKEESAENFPDDFYRNDNFYETPYDPSRVDNKVLGDDFRIVCAHFSTWKKTEGKGIKFTKEQILENATKIIKEIKERVKSDKMNYTFSPEKMKETSKELYGLVREKLPETLQKIGEAKKDQEIAGLYLVSPHSEYIWDGSKTAIIKSKKFTEHINEPLYLISDKDCWGIIKLSEPKEINQKEFEERYEEHLVENYERIEWWDEQHPLYLYEVEVIEKFDPVREVEVPQGIQAWILPKNVIFK